MDLVKEGGKAERYIIEQNKNFVQLRGEQSSLKGIF